MKKIAVFVPFLTILLASFCINVTGQSLKGKAWQSQDTLDINDPPATLVFNENATYSLIRFAYYEPGKIFPAGLVEEGEYTLAQNNLTLTRIIGSTAVSQEVYKFKWKNNAEFTLSIGNYSFAFALLSSDKDSFTPKFIVPYLKGAIAKNEIIQPCFGDLVKKIKSGNEIIAVKKESPSEPTKTFSLKGKFWQSESDSPFFGFGTLLIFHEDNTYDQVIFLPPKYSMKLNANGTYTKEEIESDKESGVSINLNKLFHGKFMETSNYLAMSEKNFSQNNAPKPYKIEWISEKEFKMSKDNKTVKFAVFCSESDLFTPKYTVPLLEKQVKAGDEIMEFFEPLTKPFRTVRGKCFSLENTDKVTPSDTYVFYDDGTYRHYSSIGTVGTYDVEGLYEETKTSLTLQWKKTFAKKYSSTTLDLEWLSSQDFILSVKGHSPLHYQLSPTKIRK